MKCVAPLLLLGCIASAASAQQAVTSVSPDSIFEIGSITKTFTGLVLAQMMLQGGVTLTEPFRELLPRGLVAKPIGAEILLDLATHRSGLPRMPDNFDSAKPENPLGGYGIDSLFAYLHPGSLPAGRSEEALTFPAAIRESQVPRAGVDSNTRIALTWNYREMTYWHEGDTAGFSAIALFDLARDLGIVVLFNTQNDRSAFAESLEEHLYARMVGRPAISLGPP